MTHETGGQALTRRDARARDASVSTRAAAAPRASVSTRQALTKASRIRMPRAPKRARHAPNFLSFAAVLAVGGLLVAVTVPANLFVADAASVVLSSAPVVDRPGQNLTVGDDVVSVGPVRDGYTYSSYAEQLRLKYADYGGSYTATTGPIRWPFPYTVPITDGFGLRPANISGQPMHNGVDFTPGAGTPIYAIADGVVTLHTEETGGFGNSVIIQHSIPDQNVESLYGHMQYGSSPVKVGDPIKVGDFIGLVGDTGNSYGAHLHLEIHIDKVPVDPFAWLQANAS